jgi:hypothetical protein
MSIDGKWSLTIKTPIGAQLSTLEVKSSKGALTGKQYGAHDEQEIKNGRIKGDTASWSIDITSPQAMTLTFSEVVVSGDSISGDVRLGPYGDSTFKGERA